LGLIELCPYTDGTHDLAVNSLARPLVTALSEAEAASIANKAIVPLYSSWKDAEGGMPADLRGWEAARLSLLGRAPPDILNASALAGTVFLFRRLHEAEPALDLVLAALPELDDANAAPDLHLLRHGADCAARLGKTDIQEMLLDRGLRVDDGDPRARAMLLYASASRFIQTGEIAAAEKRLQEAATAFESLGDEHSRAVTMGQIGDILQTRGQLDEALNVRTEEQLPVYERLGDVRSRAVTMGQIADILQARGQPDEALKIRTDEVLPAFERLGDLSLMAVEKGKSPTSCKPAGNSTRR
jgi:tetratricopeptide (TPR) repeat protein